MTAFLIENGVGDTSLRTIAAAAGTSHRMLIYDFGSREGVLTAVIERLGTSLRRRAETSADSSPGDPVAAVWADWTLLADHAALAPLVFELSALAMHGGEWQRAFVDGFAGVLGESADARVVTPGDSERVANACRAVMVGAWWQLGLTGDRTAADATVRAVLDSTWPSG